MAARQDGPLFEIRKLSEIDPDYSSLRLCRLDVTLTQGATPRDAAKKYLNEMAQTWAKM